MNEYMKQKATTPQNVELSGNEFYAEINQDNANFLLSLLTDLYSNPARAMARELITNAYDVSNGELIRVDLLENESDEEVSWTFEVEDKGCGMTAEELKNNYLTYVNSSKTYNFDAIGAFGLGGKSPLACVDMFDIYSTVKADGKYETTHARMSKKKGRIVAEMFDCDNETHTGTKIVVPNLNYTQHEQIINYVDFTVLCVPTPVFESSTLKVNKKVYRLVLDNKVRVASFEPIISRGSMPQRYEAAVCIGGILPYVITNNQNSSSINKRAYVVDVASGEFQFAPAREEIPTCDKKQQILQEIKDACPESNSIVPILAAEQLESDNPPCEPSELVFCSVREHYVNTNAILNAYAKTKFFDDIDDELMFMRSSLPNLKYAAYIKNTFNHRGTDNINMQDNKEHSLIQEINRCLLIGGDKGITTINLYFVDNVKGQIKLPDHLKKNKFSAGRYESLMNVFVESSEHDKHIEKLFRRMAAYLLYDKKSFTVNRIENATATSTKKEITPQNLEERQVLLTVNGGLRRGRLGGVLTRFEGSDKNKTWYVGLTKTMSVTRNMSDDRFRKITLPEFIRRTSEVVLVKTKKEQAALLESGMLDYGKFVERVYGACDRVAMMLYGDADIWETSKLVLGTLNFLHDCNVLNTEELPVILQDIVAQDRYSTRGRMLNRKYLNIEELAKLNPEDIEECMECFGYYSIAYSRLKDYTTTEEYMKYGGAYENIMKNYKDKMNDLDKEIVKVVERAKKRCERHNLKEIKKEMEK